MLETADRTDDGGPAETRILDRGGHTAASRCRTCSPVRTYGREIEPAVSTLDPALGLPISAGVTPIRSEQDTVAPTIARAEAADTQPDHTECPRLDRALAD
ncbi:hypothetical protein GCM10027290_63410 [Micromonospora sonneratiae]|uniref:Uncharacterized protein n=1 Tax=Micromonospora sonneratiae TaxID=1184706 RepID=A0ABW3YHR8_9ACTN